MSNPDERLAAACARLAREKGWTAEQRDRLEGLLADNGCRRALYDRPLRMEFVAHALAEMLDERGAMTRMAVSDPDEVEARVVALMVAAGLATPD